ncbi:MAG: hydrogenase formation protein HypD, partial [Deltaproteobacteria bacterium]|nr:hydrogenase formation protein HypD [Deltaproteobacteria bacterium]
MKYIDEFRKKEPALALFKELGRISLRKANIMEICGTHTHSIARYGIRAAMPGNVKLISGPGCPVCVTSQADINRVIEFSRTEKNAVIATFGDMLRVPGSFSSLEEERARGADIRIVYSPIDTIEIARTNPGKEVVFFAVGFETTAPTVGATVLLAREKNLKNFSLFSRHKLTPPAMRALLDSGDIAIDGFIAPGHVTTVIGASSYGFLAEEYGLPCVVAGFEPLDCIYGLYMLVKQINEGRHDIEIEYKRVVTWEGNKKARAVMDEVFTAADARWRGLGEIPMSGLEIRDEFSGFDAEKRFAMGQLECGGEELKGCACAMVIKGLETPQECPL